MIDLNRNWDRNKRRNETELLRELVAKAALSDQERVVIAKRAAKLVEQIRTASKPGLMDVFLAQYGLSTDEGVALMCLAEALLRVPDASTIDALIEDKIAPSDWSRHVGKSSSPLVNASTWGLLLTGKVLDEGSPGIAGRLHAMVRRLGEPVIRTAVAHAMKEMGQQFVLGQDIEEAMSRAAGAEERGFTYSYDMLGEAAMTAADAARYSEAYGEAITAIASACTHNEIASNPGISVKLSALHPRYEVAKTERIMTELVPVLTKLVKQAKKAGMGLNIDAEEMDRLGLSLQVIETVLADKALAGWDGFGVVVQAYGRRAGDVIDGLYQMAEKYDRRIMVRLVKGAYWDTEIKLAQVEGLDDFPVFTRKAATDVSYIAHAKSLLGMTDRIYPQFATHNAHTVSAILEIATGLDKDAFEFQRLHGMGEALHDIVQAADGTRCRIYAPVGSHRDLLAYLVRRLLENGANSSFVNQIVDENVPPPEVAACPFAELETPPGPFEPQVKNAVNLFAPERKNSVGFDLNDTRVLDQIAERRQRPSGLLIKPILAGAVGGGSTAQITNPTDNAVIGEVIHASKADVETALSAAKTWTATATERASILNKAADAYEADFGEIFALLATEAGKTLPDAVAELREAVDFLRYYAVQATHLSDTARGNFTCISPWNFPLAIFTGQIAAALAAGNAVLAKPAETTPAIATWSIQKLLEAGVPRNALQLLPGEGAVIGTALTSDTRINGVAFTGSTATARRIQRAMAEGCGPGTPLIAETGGLNAMIVDSTALPEQAIRDIIASAFQSAGQRCSALRCLYIQDDIADHFTKMLIGAMDELVPGDPWDISTDLGPVITPDACKDITAYVNSAEKDGRLIHRLVAPTEGSFVAPSLVRVSGIKELKREVFGPVLHLATFKADALDQVIEDVNGTGFGLTFGLHTRIDDRMEMVANAVTAGNIYANRNQIGAVVGSQPFGGEGLSGTGPKAGGPHYVPRFASSPAPDVSASDETPPDPTDIDDLVASLQGSAALSEQPTSVLLPGPTGELNRLSTIPRLPLLCLGPGAYASRLQIEAVKAIGGRAISGSVLPSVLVTLAPIGGVIWWGDEDTARDIAMALADRNGPIVPLITDRPDAAHALIERHLCVDTTAAGGNVSLLAGDAQT